MGGCCTTRVKEFNFRKKGKILDMVSKDMDLNDVYEYVKVIGRGAFGEVKLYQDRSNQDMQYAIKSIEKDYFDENAIKKIMNEVMILRSLDHPNIVKYLETYEDQKFIHIVMEYIPGVDLFTMITDCWSKKRFKESDAAKIMLYLSKTIKFLHDRGIIHRDIKPQNILFGSDEISSLKLIDFGLSLIGESKNLNNVVGSPFYMSPEVLNGDYDENCDIWAIGVILFIILTGKYPFHSKNSKTLEQKIANFDYDAVTLIKSRMSDEAKDLIIEIFVPLSKRPSLEYLINHQWIQMLASESMKNNVIEPRIIESIVSFKEKNIVYKEIMYYITKLSNENEIIELKKAFTLMDSSNSGSLDQRDFIACIKKSKVNIDQV